MKAPRKMAAVRPWALLCALLALFVTAGVSQAVVGASAQTRPGPRLLKHVEAEAVKYRDGVAEIPLRVRQTVRDFDRNGHLKRTRHFSYRYTFEAVSRRTGNVNRSAADAQGKEFRGPDLSDDVTLPFMFLPSWINHVTIREEMPKTGARILHIKSNPCSTAIKVHHGWMSARFDAHCFEGDAILDPQSFTLRRIRVKAEGLPVSFHSLPFPLKIVIYRLTVDISFHLLTIAPGTAPRLIPEKAENVITSNRGRTVVDQVFLVKTATPQQSSSH